VYGNGRVCGAPHKMISLILWALIPNLDLYVCCMYVCVYVYMCVCMCLCARMRIR